MCKKIRILLVDDQDEVRKGVTLLLSIKGYQVFSASDGATALQFLAEATDPIDILLTDIEMPLMNGWGLARKAVEQQPNLQVLYFSGTFQEGDMPNPERSLPKPFRLKDFEDLVQKILTPRQDGIGP